MGLRGSHVDSGALFAAAVEGGVVCVGMAGDAWRTPWRGAQRLEIPGNRNFCSVLTTKPRAARLSLIAGCALMPFMVRTISPSSAIRAERASARSTAWQHWVSNSTPAASSIAYSVVTRRHKAIHARRAALRVEARSGRVQRGSDAEDGRTFSLAKT